MREVFNILDGLTAEHERSRKPFGTRKMGSGVQPRNTRKGFVSAGMRRRTACGLEGRLRSNDEVARKGPRGFGGFSCLPHKAYQKVQCPSVSVEDGFSVFSGKKPCLTLTK